MEIKTAIQQYLDRQDFYAWEIWHLMQKRQARSLLQTLASIQQGGTEIMADAIPHTTTTNGNRILRLLTGYHLLARTKRGHAYYYRLTDLGSAVLACDRHSHKSEASQQPLTACPSVVNGYREAHRAEPGAMKSHKRRQGHHDWAALMPKIRQAQETGKNLREIAEALDIPCTTLKSHLAAQAKHSEALSGENRHDF
jgi:hypothetical protein